MPDQILLEQEKTAAETSASRAVKTEDSSTACPMTGQGWLKGAFGMAVCCAAPLLFFAAIAIFGWSSGTIASGALSLLAILACPVGMFMMMRMMMRNKN